MKRSRSVTATALVRPRATPVRCRPGHRAVVLGLKERFDGLERPTFRSASGPSRSTDGLFRKARKSSSQGQRNGGDRAGGSRGEPRPTQAARRSGTRRGEAGQGRREAASWGGRRSSPEQVGADEGRCCSQKRGHQGEDRQEG